ncbi:hypothetical protein [Cytophaga aurantiaca]|uniref:hypothetical protein n=1 Tax=Cytophaga aurantiaca TaxID=29530 RepID=UPI00036D00CD|nr:hypothetical protein [Cytophaga aurantiaca]
MSKIYLLLIVTGFYFSGCNTADQTDTATHVATDSIQKDTIVKVIETTKTESSDTDTTLEDGWHTIDHTNMGVNINFYGHQILNLPQKSFISFADIHDIQSELFIDGIDTARIITFDLTKDGEETWHNMISDTRNDYVYFVLDNELINLHKVFTNTDKNQAYPLELFLGYSDFTAQDGLDIEARIRKKIQK